MKKRVVARKLYRIGRMLMAAPALTQQQIANRASQLQKAINQFNAESDKLAADLEPGGELANTFYEQAEAMKEVYDTSASAFRVDIATNPLFADYWKAYQKVVAVGTNCARLGVTMNRKFGEFQVIVRRSNKRTPYKTLKEIAKAMGNFETYLAQEQSIMNELRRMVIEIRGHFKPLDKVIIMSSEAGEQLAKQYGIEVQRPNEGWQRRKGSLKVAGLLGDFAALFVEKMKKLFAPLVGFFQKLVGRLDKCNNDIEKVINGVNAIRLAPNMDFDGGEKME